MRHTASAILRPPRSHSDFRRSTKRGPSRLSAGPPSSSRSSSCSSSPSSSCSSSPSSSSCLLSIGARRRSRDQPRPSSEVKACMPNAHAMSQCGGGCRWGCVVVIVVIALLLFGWVSVVPQPATLLSSDRRCRVVVRDVSFW